MAWTTSVDYCPQRQNLKKLACQQRHPQAVELMTNRDCLSLKVEVLLLQRLVLSHRHFWVRWGVSLAQGGQSLAWIVAGTVVRQSPRGQTTTIILTMNQYRQRLAQKLDWQVYSDQYQYHCHYYWWKYFLCCTLYTQCYYCMHHKSGAPEWYQNFLINNYFWWSVLSVQFA